MSSLDAVEIFLVEARDLLEQIEQALLDLNGRLDDRDLVDTVFRGLHTLKGSGAMFGFDALAEFTHHCESAFDRVRKGEVAATSALVGAILDAQDHMRALIEDPKGDYAAASQRLLAGLNAAVSGAAPPEPGAAPQAPALQVWSIRFRLPANALVNGVNPLGLLNELRDLGECRIVADTTKIPDLEALDPTECHLGWDVTLTTDQPRSAIEDVFIFVMDDMDIVIETLDAPEAVAPEAPVVATAPSAPAAAPPPKPAAAPQEVPT
ncbi:MAG: Hpt domain-containing protein, partial [Caulobacteraceae bacterium]|nr:Hpt domain-containing protein [Caulobacteraceae bacterium]